MLWAIKKLIVAVDRNKKNSIQDTQNRMTGSKPEAQKQQIPFVF
jgi:hypothetical protein